jgi:L-fucose isomerase-like protein
VTKLRIGLAGAYFPNFDAEKLGVYSSAVEALTALAKRWDFDLIPLASGIQTSEEAQDARRQFEAESLDFLLLQASSFALGDVFWPLAELDVPLGVWGVEEPRLEGAIPLNSFTGLNLLTSILRTNLQNRKQPFKWFFGAPDSERFLHRLELTIGALTALKKLKSARIALLGEVAPGFFNLTYDPENIRARLGTIVEQIPLEEVFQRARVTNDQQVRSIVADIQAKAQDVQVTSEWMNRTGQLVQAIRSIAEEGSFDTIALRCWPEFQTEFAGFGPCLCVSWLNEIGIPTSCEGDVLSALSMLVLNYISGQTTTLMDLVAVLEEEDLIQFWHCGPTAPSLADSTGQRITYHPTLNRTKSHDQPRSGTSSDVVLKPGPITVMRFSSSVDKAFVMGGEVVEGPSRGYDGSRGWISHLHQNKMPITVPDLIETVVYYGLPHHYPIVYGDWEAMLQEFSVWSGIELLGVVPYQDYIQAPTRHR